MALITIIPDGIRGIMAMGFKTALITLLAVLPIGYGLFCVISKSTPLIHGYHVAQVAESNKERFSVFVGMGTIVFGIGIACRVLPPYYPDLFSIFPKWIDSASIVILIIGITITLGAIKKYNGTIM